MDSEAAEKALQNGARHLCRFNVEHGSVFDTSGRAQRKRPEGRAPSSQPPFLNRMFPAYPTIRLKEECARPRAQQFYGAQRMERSKRRGLSTLLRPGTAALHPRRRPE
jgi:hypothetical protein